MPQLVWTDSVTVEWSPASDPFATSPTWVDITSLVEAVSISRGRGSAFDLYGAGSCSITVSNRLGTIDPTVWYRWRQIRVTCAATGPVTNVLFRGFIEEVLHDQGGRAQFATATIQATDLMGVLSRYEYVASSVPAELSGARVNRVLTALGVPSAWKSVATGYSEIAALDDGVVNGLQHLQDVVEAEVGALWTTAAGVLTFDDRYELLDNLSASPVTVFSDTYAGAEVAYLYGDVTLTPPGREYRNKVTYTGDSGAPQTASDIPTNYPPDSISRTVPLTTDSQAMANAAYLLKVFDQTGLIWPEHLTVGVFTQNILDEMTALDLRQFCQVEFTPASKTQQTYKVFAESIEHSMSDVAWSVRVGFSSADRWEDGWGVKTDYLILDDATYGKLDTGKLAP